MARDSADARVPTNPRGHIEGLWGLECGSQEGTYTCHIEGLWGLDATSDSLDDSQTELTSIEAV